MRYHPLTRNNEFARAYTRGKSFVHPHVVLYVNKNRLGRTRVGITASKKIGNAVTRNRLRRYMREDFRQMKNQLKSGRYILIARRVRPGAGGPRPDTAPEKHTGGENTGKAAARRRPCAGMILW